MNPIRKALLATLGAMNITKAEAEHIVDDLVARGEIAETNRDDAVRQLLKEAETQKNEMPQAHLRLSR
jgi:polyhydroxyalkanoate synthesis regulator phasin